MRQGSDRRGNQSGFWLGGRSGRFHCTQDSFKNSAHWNAGSRKIPIIPIVKQFHWLINQISSLSNFTEEKESDG